MPTLADWLAEAPFGLGMSSGFFGFFAHAGMLAALDEAGHRPCGFAGSSAGALVAGLAAAGMEPARIVDELATLSRAEFWDPAPGPGFLRGAKFRARLGAMLSVTRIEECARPLVVSTFDVRRRRTHVLARGPIVPAIYASCAVPGLFHAIRHDDRWLVDGGVLARLYDAGSGTVARSK